jgi:hypothetical protein
LERRKVERERKERTVDVSVKGSVREYGQRGRYVQEESEAVVVDEVKERARGRLMKGKPVGIEPGGAESRIRDEVPISGTTPLM